MITPRQLLLAIIVCATVLSVALLTDQPYGHWVSARIGDRPFELVLQFLLITVIGGAVYALMTVLKEEQETKQIKVSAVRELDGELRDVYREIKLAKRRLRSRLKRTSSGAGWCANASDFQLSMNEILEAQIQVEALKDDLGQMGDLIDKEQASRLKKLMRYGARYLHDVYEDYEKGLVQEGDQQFVITAENQRIVDFIAMPDTDKDDDADELPLPVEVQDAIIRMESSRHSLEERFLAFDTARKYRPKQPRIAYECFRIAAVELRDAIQQLSRSSATAPSSATARRRARRQLAVEAIKRGDLTTPGPK